MQKHHKATEVWVRCKRRRLFPLTILKQPNEKRDLQSVQPRKVLLITRDHMLPLVDLQYHLIHRTCQRIKPLGITMAAPIQQARNTKPVVWWKASSQLLQERRIPIEMVRTRIKINLQTHHTVPRNTPTCKVRKHLRVKRG